MPTLTTSPPTHRRPQSRSEISNLKSVLIPLLLAALPSLAHAQRGAWHAPEWPYRAVVQVGGKPESVIDTAAVRIAHAGETTANADDFRVFDDAGEPQPYQVDYHHPRRDALLRFRAITPGRYYVYFGRPDAKRDRLRVTVPDRLGAMPTPGPSGGGWLPRAGLVLTTMRRPEDNANPQTVDAMATLIEQSPALDGAGYRHNLRDGVNPFGDSDHYISVYRGWLRVPQPGQWGFATASNEASFSFMDGRPLVHWPGRHTEKRGRRGQKNADRKLTAGLHHVAYYHEEVLLHQVAFLGWRKPGETGFTKIPDKHWPQPRPAKLVRYQRKTGDRAFMPTANMLDSVWPPRRFRDTGQYTRFRFSVGGAEIPPRNADYTWRFGDGQSAAGPTVEHVYLNTGRYNVTLSVNHEGDKQQRTIPLNVFPVEHLTRDHGFERGEIKTYQPIVRAYDPAALAPPARLQLAHFHAEAGDLPASQAAANAYLDAEHDGPPEATIEAHLLAAGEAGRPDRAWRLAMTNDAARRAAAHLEAAYGLADDAPRRLAVAARLLRHFAVEQADLEAAEAIHAKLADAIDTRRLDADGRDAMRQVLIALGDGRLAAGRFDAARDRFEAAEHTRARPIPRAVRVAKLGRYPGHLQSLLHKGDLDAANTVLNHWLGDFPLDRMRGEPLFYAGKLALAENRPDAAARTLAIAIDLGEGATWEPEARWRRAQAFGRLGDQKSRTATLKALVDSGIESRFREKALQILRDEPHADGDTP